MRQYHELTVADVVAETDDSRRVLIDVPESLQADFAFEPGQHLPLSVDTDAGELRRTYSICSSRGRFPLEIGVRIQPGGAFSNWLATNLKPGDTLRVMPPFGRFHASIDAAAARHYAAFAAGSGITPVLSIITSLLDEEPASRVTLFYGNRTQSSTMFIEDLFALKNRYPERLQLQFVFSREEQEFPVSEGRLDGDKVAELCGLFFRDGMPDEAFLCGPDSMIDEVSAALETAGLATSHIHSERFGAPRQAAQAKPAETEVAEGAKITVVMDGHRKRFSMSKDAGNIVDAAAASGIDLPYSCKGGVCATCRTHVAKGEVEMAINYGLEPWEVEAGFVLACQCVPTSEEVTLDYDKA